MAGTDWHWQAGPALADLECAWGNWREAIEARPVAQWWDVLGDGWGPFHAHNLFDLVLHAHNELTHHAAEIALLRDLWRDGLR